MVSHLRVLFFQVVSTELRWGIGNYGGSRFKVPGHRNRIEAQLRIHFCQQVLDFFVEWPADRGTKLKTAS